MTAPTVALDALDAVELAELLEFIHDWTWFHPRRAGESVGVFTAGGYTLDELRADLARFVFLLGGGEDRYVDGTAR